MVNVIADMLICHPCALQVANGPCGGCESCAFGDGRDCPSSREVPVTVSLACSDCDVCDSSYYSLPCETCGDDRDGMRHYAVLFDR